MVVKTIDIHSAVVLKVKQFVMSRGKSRPMNSEPRKREETRKEERRQRYYENIMLCPC